MITVQSLVQLLQLRPRHWIAVAAVGAALLFLPDPVRQALGVRQLADNYRQWIGLVVVVSVVLLAIHGGVQMQRVQGNLVRVRKAQDRLLERLHTLTEAEKQILRFYLAQQTKTNTLRFQDGVVQGLVAAGILYRASNVGNLIEGVDYNIAEFAWEYLHQNQGLLNGTTLAIRTDKRLPRRWE